jgi:hypothetical protein
MTLQRTNQTIVKKPERRSLSRSSRSMGIYLRAGRGTGKSRLLGRKIAMQDYLAGIPQVIFDPVGATIDNFLDKVTRFLAPLPRVDRDLFWDRIVYVDMSGKEGSITPFPLYYRMGTERSLLEIAERYLQTIIKSNPALFQAQVLGWPPLHRIGVYTGLILSALGYQITEAEDLLRHPEQWVNRFTEAEHRYPEVHPAVAFFRDEYIPMRQTERSRLTTPFLDKIFTFPLDPSLRALFGAKEPGINWNDVSKRKQTILLDFRHEQDEEMRRFKMLWAFSYLYEWIKIRGRQDDKPFGVIIDEFAHMTQQVVSGTNPLAQELDEFINVYMRQHTIWFSCAHQELYQIDEQLRNTLLSLGTYIIGGTSSMDSARELANALYFRSPYKVKDYHTVFVPERLYKDPIMEPVYMPLEEQTELSANRIKKLGRFQFLLRPALAEGHIGSVVLPLTIQHEDVDPITGEFQFPDLPLVQRVRAALAMQSGIPIKKLLAQQETRLSEPQRRELTPRQEVRESQTSRLPQPSRQGDGRPHPTNGNTPSLPAGTQGLPTTRRIRLSSE